MTKYERLQGLKPRGVRTTDDAWAKLKGWCQRLKVTLEEGLDKLLMGLDDFEGGADDRKPAKVGRPADARLVEKYKEGQEKLEADKQAFAAEYVLAPEPVETAEPKPPYKDNRIGDVTYQGTAGVESAPTPDLTQPETSIIEPEAAAAFREEAEELRRDLDPFRRQPNLLKAMELYQALVLKHPQSDKVDECAYYLGQIYASSYVGSMAKAAEYYEKCALWNPKTEKDARFRAAESYEKAHLSEKAGELYRRTAAEDPFPENREVAKDRLKRYGKN